jgi:hypothetical protein
LAHTELGLDVLNDVLKRIEGEYVMDRAPSMEGRFMSMILSPKSGRGGQAKHAAQAKSVAAEKAGTEAAPPLTPEKKTNE